MTQTRQHKVTEAGPVQDDREIERGARGPPIRAPSISVPAVAEFERRGAELLAKQHAVMVNSGTSALWLAVDLLGCEPGDEVITSPLTFSSDIAPLVRSGIVPAFVDVDLDTLQIDVDEDRGDDRAAHQGDPRARSRRQLPRLGRHPRDRRPSRPARRRGQLRRPRTPTCAAPVPAFGPTSWPRVLPGPTP